MKPMHILCHHPLEYTSFSRSPLGTHTTKHTTTQGKLHGAVNAEDHSPTNALRPDRSRATKPTCSNKSNNIFGLRA